MRGCQVITKGYFCGLVGEVSIGDANFIWVFFTLMGLFSFRLGYMHAHANNQQLLL